MKIICLILSLLFSLLCGNDLENNLDLFNETAYQFTYEMNLWHTNSENELVETPHKVSDEEVDEALEWFVELAD